MGELGQAVGGGGAKYLMLWMLDGKRKTPTTCSVVSVKNDDIFVVKC